MSVLTIGNLVFVGGTGVAVAAGGTGVAVSAGDTGVAVAAGGTGVSVATGGGIGVDASTEAAVGFAGAAVGFSLAASPSDSEFSVSAFVAMVAATAVSMASCAA